jgi:glycine hydroxymethyltransferase
VKNIVFICTGNTCRSPMAAALLRHAMGPNPGFAVQSAGVAARAGAPASPETVAVLREAGINLGDHRSRPVTSEMIREAQLILTMTRGHREVILELFPEASERVFLVGDFAGDPTLREIPDPIGCGRDAYLETRDAIVAAIPGLLAFIRQAGEIEEAEAGGHA